MVESHPNLARHDALGRGDVGAQVARQGAEPEAVVDEPGQLVRDEPVEPERVARQRQSLEGAMRAVQDGRRRRLVDLAALDADQPILDVVDPTHSMRSTDLMETLDELDRTESIAIECDGDAALELDQQLDR